MFDVWGTGLNGGHEKSNNSVCLCGLTNFFTNHHNLGDTQFHAMDTLHKHNYDISKALCSLIPATGPVLCRDEMEEWSASEANLFEEALEKYGKDFNDIRQDFVS